MKPVSITVSAFGPYARETHVSFEDVSQGLFLISGETGSGKTMIFDAIMFAPSTTTPAASRGAATLFVLISRARTPKPMSIWSSPCDLKIIGYGVHPVIADPRSQGRG